MSVKQKCIMPIVSVLFLALLFTVSGENKDSIDNVIKSKKGVLGIMSDLSSGKVKGEDVFKDDAIKANVGDSSALKYEKPDSTGRVTISFFSVTPKVAISEHKEAQYKGVIEEARRKITARYDATVDTLKNISSYKGTIRLKIFLDTKAKVKTCEIESSTLKNKEVKEYTVDYVKELDFRPVRENHKVKGMILTFSFWPF